MDEHLAHTSLFACWGCGGLPSQGDALMLFSSQAAGGDLAPCAFCGSACLRRAWFNRRLRHWRAADFLITSDATWRGESGLEGEQTAESMAEALFRATRYAAPQSMRPTHKQTRAHAQCAQVLRALLRRPAVPQRAAPPARPVGLRRGRGAAAGVHVHIILSIQNDVYR